MKEVDKAWLAAAVDGEGCIGVYKNGRGGTYFHFEIVNTNYAFLKKCLDICESGKITVKSEKNGNCNRCFIFKICKKESAIKVLEEILPYLIIKRTRAKHTLSWLEKYMYRTKGYRGNSEWHSKIALMATPESNARKGNRGNSEAHRKAALCVKNNHLKGNRGNFEKHKLAALARWHKNS